MALTKWMAAASIAALALSACGEAPESEQVTTQPEPAVETGDEVRVVGSSTVFPFATKVAQEFQNKTGNKVVIEPTGSGGGHKLFCTGSGGSTPDITNSSRPRKDSEAAACASNGVSSTEIKIGYDGIVIANAVEGPDIALTSRDVFLAFAAQVPSGSGDGETCDLQDNPYTLWSDIREGLPNTKIEVYGPPPTSGTRDAFVEIAMEGGAKKFRCLARLAFNDEDAFQDVAHTLREDGAWIDAGELDNAIVQTLVRNQSAVGVFGYSFLEENPGQVKAATIDGVAPSPDVISNEDYPIARSMFFYVKDQHYCGTVANVPSEAIQAYVAEFTDEAAWGPRGYLRQLGLVPLPQSEREGIKAQIAEICS